MNCQHSSVKHAFIAEAVTREMSFMSKCICVTLHVAKILPFFKRLLAMKKEVVKNYK